jgi:hypothetical protein
MTYKTKVDIRKDTFYINDSPTYAGRSFKGNKIEGLLMNSRMVQGIFDDLNPETRSRWNYSDGEWDAERNTNEFITNMPVWANYGLNSFTLNLQGGSPEGYSKAQPWHNSAFTADGDLRDDYALRLQRIIDRADALGMVVILGLFYFGQDNRLRDEKAVIHAVNCATDWVLALGYTNVVIEIGNEVDLPLFTHDIIKVARCHELIEQVRVRSNGRLLCSTSMRGNSVPPDPIVAASDFILLHGNGVTDPNRIRQMVNETRQRPSFRGQPILFNEDDHFNFDQSDNNMLAAISCYAGWGYFDWRMPGEGFDDGYQSVPVNWGISSARKRAFFEMVAMVTGRSYTQTNL